MCDLVNLKHKSQNRSTNSMKIIDRKVLPILGNCTCKFQPRIQDKSSLQRNLSEDLNFGIKDPIISLLFSKSAFWFYFCMTILI